MTDADEIREMRQPALIVVTGCPGAGKTTLLADTGRTHALASALHDMRASGSADLRPHLERHFGMDVPRFSAAFWAWAWSEFARGPGV